MAAVSAGGIRAGLAYVELVLRDNKFARGLAAAQAKMKAFGAGMAGLGKSMLLMDAATLAIFGLAARQFAKMGSDLLDMSDRTGMSVEALSELGFAAGQTGSSLEEVEAAIGKMQKTLSGADEESKKAVASLAKLGIEVEDLMGLAPDEQFTKLAEAISKLDDPAKRTAAAMEVFGKAGRKLIPMMKDLQALKQEGRDKGLIFSTEDAQKADQFGDKMSALWGQLKMGVAIIGGAVAPAIEKVATVISTAVTAVLRWLKENEELVSHMFKVTAAFVAFDIAVFIVGKVLWGVGVVLGVVTAALGLLVGAITFLLTPLGLVVAALGTLTFHLVSSSDQARESFGAIGEAAAVAFAGIGDAIAAGNWVLALEIASVGIQLVWKQLILTLKSLWMDFILWFTDAAKSFDTGVEEGLVALNIFRGRSSKRDEIARIRQENAAGQAGRKKAADAQLERDSDELFGESQQLEIDLRNLAKLAAERRAKLREGLLIGGAFFGGRGGSGPGDRLQQAPAAMKEASKKFGIGGTFGGGSDSNLSRSVAFGGDPIEKESLEVEKQQLKKQELMQKDIGKIAAAAAAGGIAFWK